MGRKRIRPVIFNSIPLEDINENGMVVQKNYQGEDEFLSAKVYKHKLLCKCGNSRFYKPQDRRQVEATGLCKRCLREQRLERRRAKLKKNIVREVLEESLEP